MNVRWPFGHGLSYTEFTYSAPKLSADTLSDGGEAISAEMTRSMAENAPLRAVQSFAHLPDEAIYGLIDWLNQLLKN